MAVVLEKQEYILFFCFERYQMNTLSPIFAESGVAFPVCQLFEMGQKEN